MTIHSVFFLKNVITKKDYFHEIPIYEGIYEVDSLDDIVEDTKLQQAQEGRANAPDQPGGEQK